MTFHYILCDFNIRRLNRIIVPHDDNNIAITSAMQINTLSYIIILNIKYVFLFI